MMHPGWKGRQHRCHWQYKYRVGLCWPSAKVHTPGAFRLAESAEEDHARKDHTDIGHRFQNILLSMLSSYCVNSLTQEMLARVRDWAQRHSSQYLDLAILLAVWQRPLQKGQPQVW